MPGNCARGLRPLRGLKGCSAVGRMPQGLEVFSADCKSESTCNWVMEVQETQTF